MIGALRNTSGAAAKAGWHTGMLVLITAALFGCASPSATQYAPSDVGRSISTARGTVIAAKPVTITGESNAWGPGAGGALGAAGAYGIFGSGWTSVIGGVLGAGVGYAAQELANTRSGFEYIVRMEDGTTQTIVQNRDGSGDVPLPPGTPVLVQTSGNYNRVIPDPTASGVAPAGLSGAVPPAAPLY
jgi:outer membrane lipoprotein SlyB